MPHALGPQGPPVFYPSRCYAEPAVKQGCKHSRVLLQSPESLGWW